MKVERKQMADACAKVAQVASARGIPALSGVRIREVSDGLELEATDLETSVRIMVDGTGSFGPDPVIVPARVVRDVVKRATGTTVTLEGSPGGARVAGIDVRAVAPASDWPELSHVWDGHTTAENTCGLEAAAFRDLVGRVAPAASTDEGRPVLTGLFLEGEAETLARLRMTATDSYRLHTSRHTMWGSWRDPMIVPAAPLKRAARWIGARGAGGVSLRRVGTNDTGHIVISYGRWELGVLEIVGTYPTWRQLVPDRTYDGPEASFLSYHGPGILEAVRAAGTVTDGSVSPVVFSSDGMMTTVRASSADLGSFEAVLSDVDYRGEPCTFGVNAGYFLEALEATDPEAGVIMLRPGSSGTTLKPMILGDDDTTALVMPVRLPESSYVREVAS